MLAGGCAYNSVANGKIRSAHAIQENPICNRPRAMRAARSAQPTRSGTATAARAHRADVARLLGAGVWRRRACGVCASRSRPSSPRRTCNVRDHRRRGERSSAVVAQAIADGQVVGWFQGRMEWGPRALGNRSILGDPRRADMKEHPQPQDQAPRVVPPVRAVDAARGGAGLVRERRRRAVHAARCFRSGPSGAEHIPAVTHVDGTGRLQTVTAAVQPALSTR